MIIYLLFLRLNGLLRSACLCVCLFVCLFLCQFARIFRKPHVQISPTFSVHLSVTVKTVLDLIHFLLKVERKGSRDESPPVESRGKASVKGLGNEVPQKQKHFDT